MKRILISCLTLLLCNNIVANSHGSKTIWSECAANRWEDAFVTGNGRQGTMVLGIPFSERIICVHEELFIRETDGDKVIVPNTSNLIPEARKLMENHCADSAAVLITSEAEKKLAEQGATNRWPLIPHPAFDLNIVSINHSSVVNNYKRSLNLETGVTSVLYDDENGAYEESVFTSRTENVNVIRFKVIKGKKLNLLLSLDETPGRKGSHFDHDLANAFKTITSKVSEGWLEYHAEYATTIRGYDGIGRVTHKGGVMSALNDKLRIEGADEVMVVIKTVPYKGEQGYPETIKGDLLELSYDYDKILSDHEKEHFKLFNAMTLNLGQSTEWGKVPVEKMLDSIHADGVTPLFLEQLYAMGRYLLISSCGKYPPPLQGIWGGSWKPAWIGGFVWDSNINLAISATTLSNLPECAVTYNNYIKDLLPGWRINAKNYLGCRGFIVAHYNDPENGYLTHFGKSFPWMFWAAGAGWNIRPLYEYGMIMGDKDYLKNEVYPLYKEMAQFYEDYLTLGKDGLYHIEFSVSPENTPLNQKTWLSKDATMDIAVAREVFTILLSLGRKYNEKSLLIEKWEGYLKHLPYYRINSDGALAEWVDKDYADIYEHRHSSHMYPIFPGTELLATDIKPELRNSIKVAFDKRFAFDTSSAHGLIHLALQATRMKDKEKVGQLLDRFSKREYLYKSLITSHEPNKQIYNLDAVLSFPRLLMEMLVYTQPGILELLPAWPEKYPQGCVKGMRIYGGHTIDMEWGNGEFKNMIIYAACKEDYKIKCGNDEEIVKLKKGKRYQISFASKKLRIEML